MARIKIKDLPKDVKITKEEMKKVFGGMIIALGRIPTYKSTGDCDSGAERVTGARTPGPGLGLPLED